MERCPNCGSSVRIGAKFCTTCGFRLPSEAPAPPVAASSRSPFDTTSTASVSNRWPIPESPAVVPVPEPPVAPEVVEDDPPIPQMAELVAPPAAPVEDPAAFTGWPTYGNGFSSRPGWNEEQSADAETPTPADLTGESDVKSVEDAISAWTGIPAEAQSDTASDLADAIAEEVTATDIDTPADSLAWFDSIEPENNPVDESSLPERIVGSVENPHTGEYEEFLNQIDPAESQTSIESSEPETAAADSVEGELTDESIPVDDTGAIDEPTLTTGTVAATTGAAATSVATASDPAIRAFALLEELKSLLPQLDGSSATAGVNIDEIVAELSNARSLSEEEKINMQSLRAAIATAQARPRDVDVMLDLVSRSGEIAALFMAHDAYAEAIDRAIDKLKGEHKPEPARRW